MMLPDELEWVLEMLGYRWPTADEDKLKECAALWRKFGDDVTELHTAANASARQVVAHNAGESIDAFTKVYAKFDGGGSGGYLANAAQAAYIIATVLEACAYLVEFAKWAVIAQLIALAIEIAAAQAAAPFTFGLSEVGALGATQATRLIVRRLLDELKEALLEAIVEAMKEPAISMIEAIITDLIRQTVNVGFGAQEGYDLATTVKKGTDSAWDAIKQTPQTLAEGVRDSLGEKAGHRAHHAIDSRIDGHEASGSEGRDGSSDGDGDSDSSGSDRDSDSTSNNSSDSSSNSSSDSSSSDSSSDSSSAGSHSSSNGSGSSGSDSSPSTRSDSGPGTNIGGGISADTGATHVGTPDLGAGPDSDSSGPDTGQNPSTSDIPTPRHTTSLSDFDDPQPSGPSHSTSDTTGSSGAPGTSGPSGTGGGSSPSGISSPTPHTAPSHASSSGTTSPTEGGSGGGIGTSIDSLAANVPTHSSAAPTPTTSDPSPAATGGGGRVDGVSAIPTPPVTPSTTGVVAGSHQGGGTSGSASPAATPTSPTANSTAVRTPSASTSGTAPSTGTGPASTPNPTSPTTPRSTPGPTADGRISSTAPSTGTTPASTPNPTSPTTPRSTQGPTADGRVTGTADGRVSGTADGRVSGTADGRVSGTADGRIPTQRTPGSTTPGDGTTPRNTPGTTPGDRTPPRDTPGTRPGEGTTPRNTPPGDGTTPRTTPGTTPGDGTTPRSTTAPAGGTPTRTPGQNPSTGTPNQNPSQSSSPRTTPPSTSTSTTTPSASAGTGSERGSTPSSGTSNSSTPSSRTPNSSTPPGPAGSPTAQSTPGTSGAQNRPGTDTGPTPTRPPQEPAGSTPRTPNGPQQPAAQPNTPSQNAPSNSSQQQQQHHQVAAVPIHTPVHTPSASASPSHSAGPATPHHPGSPQATPGTPNHQQHPQQDSLEDIRADLDHYPGGLSEPDPADQQALVDAVPHNEDGTPQRFPDPFGSWAQLQNDGGSTVPGRSNNCADCSRSFLETWYGNPQVSAPRTLDADEHGNPDVWSPENNANDNQIRWTGAAHTYAGPGNNPDTVNNIASTLQQAGHGSAAIVQVDWPGGGGHAFNAVNHHGDIIWIDTQTGQVSHDPIHIDNAEHVWHIPLDADRNPIDTSQPHAENSEDAEHGTDTPQDGSETSQSQTDTSQEGTDASQQEKETTSDPTEQNQAQSDPSGETPDHTPADGSAEGKPQTTREGTAHADSRQSDVPSEGRRSDATGASDSTSARPEDESRNEGGSNRDTPRPQGDPSASDNGIRTADTVTPGPGATDSAPEQTTPSPTSLSDDAHVHTVSDDAVPSASHAAPNDPTIDRSVPQEATFPDSRTGSAPADHPTSESPQQKAPGDTPSTGHQTSTNQAPNTSASAASSHSERGVHGNAAADRRGPEAPAGSDDKSQGAKHKKDDEQGENKPKKPKKTAAERAAELARAREIANTPLDSAGPEGHPGYGVVQQGDGSSVHHDMLGDASQNVLRRANDVVQTDLHAIAQHLHNWAEGDPSPLLQTVREASQSGRLTRDRLNELLKPGFAEMSREDRAATVAAIARLSSAFHDAHAVDDSGGADLHSRHQATRGEHLDPAPLARRYAATQDLADKDAHELAEGGEALSESNQQKSEQEIRRERLNFNKLWNRHVGDAQLKRAIEQAVNEGRPQAEIDAMREHRRMMRPDFSGKNFAALEIIEHKPDGTTETHYIIDSSNPPLDHSEPVLGEAFRRLDQENPGRYEAPIMYTEFEPCGDRTHPAYANCSDYIAHELERPAGQELKRYHEKSDEEKAAIPEQKNKTKIVYGAGYRLGDLSPDEMARINGLPPEKRDAEIERVRQQAVDARNADMHRFRGELARVWMKLAASADVP
ncbi:toxin glutamine deamidase domain-containing protein [Streptomyces cynarae]|uniref:toxin glutamine deamidase domain-containing protein n=1 Tax=Streptomyces cynarae TaxID=2981134 RepID=UPI00406C0DD0